MHRATMATGNKKPTSDNDLSTYLRQKLPSHALSMGRMSANQGTRAVGNMSTAGSTLIVGKNKVTAVSGIKNDVRSFTDPLVLQKHHKLGHAKSSSYNPISQDKTGPGASSRALPVLGADLPAQLTAWFHEPRTYEQDVMIDSGALPGLTVGNIYEMEPVTKDAGRSAKKLVFVVKRENILSKEPASATTASAAAKTKANVQISLLSSLQKLLDIPPRSSVQVKLISDISTIEIDAVEVYLKDVNFSRDSQWSLSSSMVGTCCHIDQRVSYLGNRVGSIKTIFKDGRRLFSGYIGPNTSIIFRSESAKLVFLVQLAREMWHFEENGEVMFHKLVNSLFPKIFKKWRTNNSHHSITIVLFTSVDLTQTPWISLGGGERPSNCKDYYRVVVDQVSVFKWDTIMANLRLEFANFKRDVLLDLESNELEIRGEACPSVKGNLLEAINLSLSLVCDRFRNTDLRHTINHLVVISPGTGIFDVDHDEMLATSKKMFSLDTALDIICLSQPPLHTVPLFRYRDEYGKVAHCVPKWCDVSFFSEASTNTSNWIPRCKIYELQMMGVMENEVKEIQVDRLHFKEKIPITESMDAYDEKLFRPVNKKHLDSISLLEKLTPRVAPFNNVATLSLMRGVEKMKKPAVAKIDVSTTNSSALGTVATTSNSALSTLYSLNRNVDDVKGKLFTPLRKVTSAATTIRSSESKSSLNSSSIRSFVPKHHPPSLNLESTKFKKRSRLRKIEKEPSSKVKAEKKHSAIELEQAERDENNPYWMQVVNPSKQTSADGAQCSRWADVFPPKIVRSMFKWRSLKAPAALPILTSLFPTSKQLETEYTFQIYVVTLNHENKLELTSNRELMREMIRLRLAMGFQICYGERVKRIEAERKPGGSPESLLKYFPRGDVTGLRIYLSLNDEIHRLFFDYNGTLNVQLYRKAKTDEAPKVSLGSRKKSDSETALIRTRYADEYSRTKVKESEPSVFNWNQFDQVLAGYDDGMSSVTSQYHKMKFVIMPGPMPVNAYNINNDKLSDEEIRVEGLRKLIATIERGKYVRLQDRKKHGKKEEILPEISFYTGNLYDFLREQADYFDMSGTRPDNSLMVSDGLRFNMNINLPSLATELQGPGGLKLVDRTWHFKLHPHCFLGSELVSWLIEAFEDIDSREDATVYGQSLIDKGLLAHVENRHGFLDGHYFYEFKDEYADQIHKIKRGSAGWFKKREGGGGELAADSPSTPSHTRNNSDNDSSASGGGAEPPVIDLRKVISQNHFESESSSLTDSQKLKKKKTFMISKHVKYNCDPLQKSFRPEVLDVHYDRVHNPEHCYHIRLQWLNTTTKFIDETIISWSRLCERYGLRLVETPWSELCTIPKLNPFHSFVDLKLAVNPLTDPEYKDSELLKVNKFYYHLHFLKKADFLLDNRGASFFLRNNIEICYSWGLASFKYAQFIHRTGAYIVELRDNGNFFMAPNNVHILRMNTLTNVIPEQGKHNVFDSQKVMMNFRESCKDEAYLRGVFEEATEHFQKEYETDFLLGM